MKSYRITYYEEGVQHSQIIQASTKEEALSKAWSLVDADDLYVSEVPKGGE